MGHTEGRGTKSTRWLRDYYDVRTLSPGGFVFLAPEQLLLPYWARRSGRISPLAFRLYYAAVEIAKRRKGTNAVGKLNSLQEACELVGSTCTATVRRAARELVASGLLRWRNESIEFAKEGDVGGLGCMNEYWEFKDRVGACARRKLAVPMSRRVLTAIARGDCDCIGATAVVFAVSLRCLRRRRVNGSHVTVSGGLCSTAWVASAFEVGHSTVKRWMSNLGHGENPWLKRLPTKQWVQQRWGARTLINLDWLADGCKVRPLRTRTRGQMRPPYRNKDLSSKVLKNQDPRRAGPVGLKRNREKRWRIAPSELQTLSGVLACYERASESGLLDGVEAPRETFVAGAIRARRLVARQGGCAAKLFGWMVHRRMWHFLKWEEERDASKRLRGVHRQAGRGEDERGNPGCIANVVSEVMSELASVKTAA